MADEGQNDEVSYNVPLARNASWLANMQAQNLGIYNSTGMNSHSTIPVAMNSKTLAGLEFTDYRMFHGFEYSPLAVYNTIKENSKKMFIGTDGPVVTVKEGDTVVSRYLDFVAASAAKFVSDPINGVVSGQLYNGGTSEGLEPVALYGQAAARYSILSKYWDQKSMQANDIIFSESQYGANIGMGNGNVFILSYVDGYVEANIEWQTPEDARIVMYPSDYSAPTYLPATISTVAGVNEGIAPSAVLSNSSVYPNPLSNQIVTMKEKPFLAENYITNNVTHYMARFNGVTDPYGGIYKTRLGCTFKVPMTLCLFNNSFKKIELHFYTQKYSWFYSDRQDPPVGTQLYNRNSRCKCYGAVYNVYNNLSEAQEYASIHGGYFWDFGTGLALGENVVEIDAHDLAMITVPSTDRLWYLGSSTDASFAGWDGGYQYQASGDNFVRVLSQNPLCDGFYGFYIDWNMAWCKPI